MASDLYARFQEEFRVLLEAPDLHLVISPVDAWILLSQLQLALRHPENQGPSAEIARKIARFLQESMQLTGTLAEVAELGWQKGGEPEGTLPL